MYEGYSLKSWHRAPPGGWFYFQPVSDLRISGKDSIELISQILHHRQYKKLDRCSTAEIKDDVEKQIIERIDGNGHYCTSKQVGNVSSV